MREQFLHYVWRHHRFNHQHLQTVSGENIQIIEYGWANPHDGPDFLNAKIKIDGVLWVGHVEIHVNTSDWDKHHHSKDPQYQNVILHIVYRHDKEIENKILPTLELNGLIPKSIYDKYLSLVESTALLPCQHLISDIEPHMIDMYLQRLSVERMENKVAKIEELLHQFHNDFEQVSFIWLCRYFGIGSNADAFQELATQIPVQWCYKIQDQADATSALLLGKAGFLKHIESDEKYLSDLLTEFHHYQQKWEIYTMHPQWWKWKMGRPTSFPTLKLAQFAKLVEQQTSIFQLVLNIEKLTKAIREIELHPFWDEHYLLHKLSISIEKSISINFVHRIIINVSVPIMIAYGRMIDEAVWIEKAFEILEKLPAEQNKITKVMHQSGLKNLHALDSQALLHLKNEYCDLKNCLNCQIGHRIIQSKNRILHEPTFESEFVSVFI